MGAMQLKIDFNEGKKDNKITISVTDELKQTLDKLTKVYDGEELAKLCGKYVAECAGRDISIFLKLQADGKIPINMAQL